MKKKRQKVDTPRNAKSALRQLRQLRWILLAASSSRRRSARSQSQGQVWHGLAPWLGNQWEINEKSTLVGGFNMF